jgi:hypothetical protein
LSWLVGSHSSSYLDECCCTSTQALTWKNNILRRRHWVVFLLEIGMPVALTLAMLGIYNTITPEKQPDASPSVVFPTDFPTWRTQNLQPRCTYHAANIFWRCPRLEACIDTRACDRLTLAVMPSDDGDSGAVSAATTFFYQLRNSSHGGFGVRYFRDEAALSSYVNRPAYATDARRLPNLGAAVVFTSGSVVIT